MWSKGGLLSQGDSEREQALTRRGLRNRKFGLGDFSGNRGERNWKTRRQAEVWRVRDNKRLPSFCLSVLFSIFLRREAREEGILAPVTGSVEKEGWNSNSTIRIHGSTECLIGLRWISEVCSVVVSRCARNGERERGNLDPRPPTSSSSNRSLRPITRIYELDFCPVSSDILSKSNGIH